MAELMGSGEKHPSPDSHSHSDSQLGRRPSCLLVRCHNRVINSHLCVLPVVAYNHVYLWKMYLIHVHSHVPSCLFLFLIGLGEFAADCPSEKGVGRLLPSGMERHRPARQRVSEFERIEQSLLVPFCTSSSSSLF